MNNDLKIADKLIINALYEIGLPDKEITSNFMKIKMHGKEKEFLELITKTNKKPTVQEIMYYIDKLTK